MIGIVCPLTPGPFPPQRGQGGACFETLRRDQEVRRDGCRFPLLVEKRTWGRVETSFHLVPRVRVSWPLALVENTANALSSKRT